MRWFEGDISQAVTQSRARNAVFVVFVEGKDEASQKISAAIDNPDISTKLEGPNFVSIHLESGTQTFAQFSQIYRDPPVPSLYFIGRNGAPIDVVTQAADAKSLSETILHVEAIHLGKSVDAQSSATTSQAPLTQSSSSTSVQSNERRQEDGSTKPIPATASLDDRVERAKELLEEKKLKKKVEEEEDARRKEMQRRKEGQNVQELRRRQQDEELKQLKEERMKDKRLEQEARQRVLEQIAQDRAARNAQKVTTTPSSAASQATASSSVSSNINEARLQFRLPDGSTHSSRFNADNTLADVRQYIATNVTLPYRDFALATAFPRREFSSQDNASTLRELELIPSSVMLIIPASGNSSVQRSGPGLFGLLETVWMYMTYPVTRVFSYLRLFIFGTPAPGSGTSPSSSTSAGSAQTQSQPSSQHEKRSQRRSGGAYRRSGNSNVHRLHQNNSSSDDENNTWNGNSTQQM